MEKLPTQILKRKTEEVDKSLFMYICLETLKFFLCSCEHKEIQVYFLEMIIKTKGVNHKIEYQMISLINQQ